MEGSMTCNQPSRRAAATRADNDAVLVSLELSRSKWLVTSLLPGSEKMSKHTVAGGASAALLARLSALQAKAAAQVGRPVKVIVIQEAGLDGFWLHRLLEGHGLESWVVDPASIPVPRRRRRAKTDRIDGESLLRALAAWLRGERRVCSMVMPPSAAEEDRRRVVRERETLVKERIALTNRIRGLLAGQGIAGYDPLRREARRRLESLITGDGRQLPVHLKGELLRMLERIEVLQRHIAEVEAARQALLAAQSAEPSAPAGLLLQLRGIGPEFTGVLWLEGLFRSFANRRRVAAYGGLAPSPWQSGQVSTEQGIGKAGNPRLRKTMIELAWLWLRYQPGAALSQWFQRRVGSQRGRVRRIAIVALARKLLIALWRYVTQGVIPEGAALKPAA
jgi:transposase